MLNIMMHIDNLVQYDEYRMPKDSAFLDNQEVNEEEQNENEAYWKKSFN